MAWRRLSLFGLFVQWLGEGCVTQWLSMTVDTIQCTSLKFCWPVKLLSGITFPYLATRSPDYTKVDTKLAFLKSSCHLQTTSP
jgi:hypothetical protein